MDELKQSFFNFIENPFFPCIGAKAAIKKNCLEILVANSIDSSNDDIEILVGIYQFLTRWKKKKNVLQTFGVIFEHSLGITEREFEAFLWERLQNLHNLDKEIYGWDKNVSDNLDSAQFSISIGEHGFFVVGLHPHSSRKSRRFIRPALIFNLHEQFEQLKRNGKFEPMKNKIRERDLYFSGSVNPMLNDFGKESEALQYSGRLSDAHDVVPFVKNPPSEIPWNLINPCSGKSFILNKGDLLIVEDVEGEQVSDLFCISLDDNSEFLSSGKSIDTNGKIILSTGDTLYSNQSNAMLRIINDDVGKHDFIFAPCSRETFHILYGETEERTGCYEHLAQAFKPFNFPAKNISTTFNIFMNVHITPKGLTKVRPPLSKTGDKIMFQSCMNLLVGLTACSAPESNNYSFKPIRYKILKKSIIE